MAYAGRCIEEGGKLVPSIAALLDAFSHCHAWVGRGGRRGCLGGCVAATGGSDWLGGSWDLGGGNGGSVASDLVAILD